MFHVTFWYQLSSLGTLIEVVMINKKINKKYRLLGTIHKFGPMGGKNKQTKKQVESSQVELVPGSGKEPFDLMADW